MKRKVSLILSLIMIIGLLGSWQIVNAATYDSSINVGQTKMYTPRADYAVETATWSVRGNDDALWIVSQDDISCNVIGMKPTTGDDYAILRCDYYYFRNGLLMSGYTDYYITVNPVYPTSISVSPSNIVIAEGQDYMPEITVYPSGATRGFLYFDEPSGIVSFWEDGRITGRNPGTTTITIMAKYGAKTTTMTVTVTAGVKSLELTPEENMMLGDTKELNLTVLPAEATGYSVEWKSSDENVVKISNQSNSSATLTAVGDGTATITASANGKSASCTVTVKRPEVQSISLPGQVSLLIQASKQLIPEIRPAQADKSVQWSSSNENIVKVAADGTITGINEGKAVITAKTSNGLSAKCEVSVSLKTPQNITVSDITEKTYGDGSFVVTATPDTTSQLNEFTFESSNTDVAAIAPDGTVTIKAAGETDITVKQAGNETYAPFTKTQKLVVKKADIAIKANDIQIVKGSDVPTLTYAITSGQLFGDDEITGAPATAANGTKLGTFDITKGTLAVSSNYNLTFTKGTLTVVDKTPQNITVSDITEKTYGDSSFVVAVTPDSTSQLTEFTFESSNTDVAEIAADGTVTIKAAGETDITVKQAGNETYAAFTKTQKLVVKKVAITINADAKMKKVGAAEPELTYQVVGELVNGDSITGSLERKSGEEIGQYDILIGTLAINNNYDITYNKAIFEIVDKTPQNITVSDITEKTYGDSSFVVAVTPDSTSQLTEFTFESSNTDVAEIAADGTVTIKAAGETDITVKQAGNDEYASFEKTQKLVVNKKSITITSINLDEKTAILEGVLTADTAVSLDFEKIYIEITGTLDETTSNVLVKNFVLIGEKAENYNVSTETLASTITTDNIVSITITSDNGTVTGAGNYIKGSNVTVTATANSGYKFSGWLVDNTSVSTTESYTFTADVNTVLTAKFTRKSSGGGGGISSYTIKFETNGGNKIANKSARRNAIITEPTAPTKDGYVFKGWYTDKELTTVYDFNTKITKSFTLYAAWGDIKESQIILTIGQKEALVFGETKLNDVAPLIRNDRTMLPARFVAENLGATVKWDGTAPGIVTITKDDVKIVIYIGEEYAVVNGEKVKLDSPAFIENDRTYTPIRFIAEKLGSTVDWNPDSQIITITK